MDEALPRLPATPARRDWRLLIGLGGGGHLGGGLALATEELSLGVALADGRWVLAVQGGLEQGLGLVSREVAAAESGDRECVTAAQAVYDDCMSGDRPDERTCAERQAAAYASCAAGLVAPAELDNATLAAASLALAVGITVPLGRLDVRPGVGIGLRSRTVGWEEEVQTLLAPLLSGSLALGWRPLQALRLAVEGRLRWHPDDGGQDWTEPAFDGGGRVTVEVWL